MAVVNYAEAYQQALAQKYATAMYFGALFTTPNNSVYKFIDAKTIKIPVITVKGRTEANRDAITGFTRSHDNEWETKTLGFARTWKTMVHPMDVNESNMVMSIQNATAVFNNQEKLPEKQKYLVSKLFSDMSTLDATHVSTATLTVDNVLTSIDAIAEKLDEASVPSEGRMLYVNPRVNTLIKQAKEKMRYLTATEGVINRTVYRIDDFNIVPVPSDLMLTTYNFGLGAVPGAGAKQIEIFAVHPLSVLTPEKYAFAGMQEPSVLSEGKYAYYEEAYEDAFILNQRKSGIYFVTKI